MTTATKARLMTSFCLISLPCVASDESGSVYFANRFGFVDAPFYDQDGVFLSGPEYVAQLYAWKEDEGFLPICFPVDFARGYDLRLMSVADLSKVPDAGRGLVVVVRNTTDDTLHFRVFDLNGQTVIDNSETDFPDKAIEIADLKGELAALWELETPSAEQQETILDAVTSVTGRRFARDGYFRGGGVTIPFVRELYPAWVQVRAWKLDGGATFEEAALAGAWSGTSEVLYVSFLGTGGGCTGGSAKVALDSVEECISSLGAPISPPPLVGLAYPGPPLVVRQPESRTIRVRDQVQLSVVASSGVRAFYQWHQSPSAAPYGLIPGATNATYTTPRLVSDTTYWVSIRNAGGTTVSDPAVITVDGPALTPRLTLPEIVSGRVYMYLEGEPGVDYEVQYRSAVNSGEWTPLRRVQVSPLWNKELISQPLSADSAARFYRAVALP